MYDCFVDRKGTIYNPAIFGLSIDGLNKLNPNQWYECTDSTKVRIANSDREEERMTREINNANA